MYTLIKIEAYDMERDLYFQNKETGRIDKVFDDNEHTAIRIDPKDAFKNMSLYNVDDSMGNNFSFLKLNEDYDCKFMLCGNNVDKNNSKAKCYHIVSREKIGLVDVIKVEQDGNIYYVSAKRLDKQYNNEDLYIDTYRIDLVEVNGIAHQWFLDEVLAKYS